MGKTFLRMIDDYFFFFKAVQLEVVVGYSSSAVVW